MRLMKKIMMQAIAKQGDVLEVTFSKDFYTKPQNDFRIYEDGKLRMKVRPVSQSESGSSYIYTMITKGLSYVPGRKYQVKTKEN